MDSQIWEYSPKLFTRFLNPDLYLRCRSALCTQRCKLNCCSKHLCTLSSLLDTMRCSNAGTPTCIQPAAAVCMSHRRERNVYKMAVSAPQAQGRSAIVAQWNAWGWMSNQSRISCSLVATSIMRFYFNISLLSYRGALYLYLRIHGVSRLKIVSVERLWNR